MGSRGSRRVINMPAPYLKRIWLDPSLVGDAAAYPFCLPFIKGGFELEFDCAITIVVGENGTGKSTLWRALLRWRGMTKQEEERATDRSIIPAPSKLPVGNSHKHCGRVGCQN